jgi:hypothetical protein
MLSENTARMGDKAKPSGVSDRRRLCCLRGRVRVAITQVTLAFSASLKLAAQVLIIAQPD